MGGRRKGLFHYLSTPLIQRTASNPTSIPRVTSYTVKRHEHSSSQHTRSKWSAYSSYTSPSAEPVCTELLRNRDKVDITSVLGHTNTTTDSILNDIQQCATPFDGGSTLTASQSSFSSSRYTSLCTADFNEDSLTEIGSFSPAMARTEHRAGTVRRCLKPVMTKPTDFVSLPANCSESLQFGPEQEDSTISLKSSVGLKLSTTEFTSVAAGMHPTTGQETLAGCSVGNVRQFNSTQSSHPWTEEQTLIGENSIIPLDDSLEDLDETTLVTDKSPNGGKVLTQTCSGSVQPVDLSEHKQHSLLDARRNGLSTQELGPSISSLKSTNISQHENEFLGTNKPDSKTTLSLKSPKNTLPSVNRTDDLTLLLSEFSPEHQHILHIHGITKRKEDFQSGIWDSSTDSSCEDI